ncbi:MAG: hypothetical protein ACD_47C00646G0001, partial [uncultured bacterium]
MSEKFLKYSSVKEMPLHYKPAHEIRRMIDSGEISPPEIS